MVLAVKRRKSRSGKRRKSKHTDNGLINDKDDNIKIELELLLKNEPVLFQDILSKIIGEKLNEEEIEYVLIHDSVRPLVCDEIINNVIDNLEKDLGVIPIIVLNKLVNLLISQ